MQRFMCTHTVPAGSMTREQVCQLADAAQHETNVRGYRSFVNLSDGKACCILDAENRASIIAWFAKMRLPYDSIIPVELEGDRGMIEDRKEQPTMAGVS